MLRLCGLCPNVCDIHVLLDLSIVAISALFYITFAALSHFHVGAKETRRTSGQPAMIAYFTRTFSQPLNHRIFTCRGCVVSARMCAIYTCCLICSRTNAVGSLRECVRHHKGVPCPRVRARNLKSLQERTIGMRPSTGGAEDCQ